MFLAFRNKENRALFACSAILFFARVNDPFFAKYIPRYLYACTISILLALNLNSK